MGLGVGRGEGTVWRVGISTYCLRKGGGGGEGGTGKVKKNLEIVSMAVLTQYRLRSALMQAETGVIVYRVTVCIISIEVV